MDGRKVVLDLGRGYGIMPPEEQMRGEFYRVNSRITVYIKEIRESFKGKVIIVSRADAQLVSQLFAREVPEVGTGAVEVALIAREAGVRTKLAVRSTQEGVDPVALVLASAVFVFKRSFVSSTMRNPILFPLLKIQNCCCRQRWLQPRT